MIGLKNGEGKYLGERKMFEADEMNLFLEI